MSTSKIARKTMAGAAAMCLLPLTLSAAIINVDFNGVRNGDQSITSPGPTYVGQSAAGGGTVWNGVLADSRVEGNPDNDALFFGATNLVDSLGNPTTLWFNMGPVAGGNQGAQPGSDAALFENLIWDWVLVGYFTEMTGVADFTIGGLGPVPSVDLYFYHRGDFPGAYVIPNAVATPFPGLAPFTPNTVVFFQTVPVVDGQIVGQFTEGGTLLGLSSGFTVAMPDPGPFVKSTSPAGVGIGSDTPIKVEIWDYITQVDPALVQIFLNDQPVTPVTTERVPGDANFVTVTATPAGGYLEGVSNVVKIVFGDTSTTPVFKTNVFGFVAAVGAEGHRAINIDIDGWRLDPLGQPQPVPVTYVGQGAAGGGTVFNRIDADSTMFDDNLMIGATNLLDSLGDPTTVVFTLGPVAGMNESTTTDPTSKNNLFGDFVAVGFQGQYTGTSDFVISGLGNVPTVDLYFYFREDPLSNGEFAGSAFTIAGTDAEPFTPTGIFNDGNTVYIKNAPVVGGQVSGVFSGQVGGGGEGSAAGAFSGLSIQKPLPQPYVRRALPKGDYVQPNAQLQIELQDYVTQVDGASIQLRVDGESVTPTISKPAGSTITTVTYTPSGGWVAEETHTMTIVFANNVVPPLVQTNEFSFFVISPMKASRIVNIDINGYGHSTLPIGPTYVGSGGAGGGSTFNGIIARTRLEDGRDDDAITIGGTNLLNSMGEPTTFTFSLGPVGAGNSGAIGGEYSEKWSSINHDWAIIGYFFAAPDADFTITGLGDVAAVNLYFYCREDSRNIPGAWGFGAFTIPGVSGPTAFAGRGLFNSGNTTFFAHVPVVNGTITGRWSRVDLLAMMTGLTIELPLPHAYTKSYGPQGAGWTTQEQVIIELSDFDPVMVDPQSIVLSVNGQPITPTVNKPAGSTITTLTYLPTGGWPQGSSNFVRLVYGDTAAPVLLQTNEFSFSVVNNRLATNIINVDFNGSRNGGGGPPVIGPTYVGVSAPGGGRTWNGIVADSRLPDGQDNDALYFSAADLVTSIGTPTTVTFDMGPVAGGNQGTGASATDILALWYDWVLVGFFGEINGTADFTIGGLGTNATADLYFYHRGDFPGTYVIGTALPVLYSGPAPFDAAHVVCFRNVPITDGTIVGQLTEGSSLLGLVSGFSIAFPVAETKPPGPLAYSIQGKQLILSWPGAATLQSADLVTGGWTDVPGATSPYTVDIGAGAKYFRLKN